MKLPLLYFATVTNYEFGLSTFQFQIERDSLNSYEEENDFREDDEFFDEIEHSASPEKYTYLFITYCVTIYSSYEMTKICLI